MDSSIIHWKSIQVNPGTWEILEEGGEVIPLTRSEFETFYSLISNPESRTISGSGINREMMAIREKWKRMDIYVRKIESYPGMPNYRLRSDYEIAQRMKNESLASGDACHDSFDPLMTLDEFEK